MGHNGKDEIMVEASQCRRCYMVEVPVPALKEQVASITAVVTEQQCLICRGKVMKDDPNPSTFICQSCQLLSA